MFRIARRVVVFQWDDAEMDRFWLIRDYIHGEYHALTTEQPSFAERATAIGARVERVLIPWDCADGFFHAYWRRPRAYLEDRVDAEARYGHASASTQNAEPSRPLPKTSTTEPGNSATPHYSTKRASTSARDCSSPPSDSACRLRRSTVGGRRRQRTQVASRPAHRRCRHPSASERAPRSGGSGYPLRAATTSSTRARRVAWLFMHHPAAPAYSGGSSKIVHVSPSVPTNSWPSRWLTHSNMPMPLGRTPRLLRGPRSSNK